MCSNWDCDGSGYIIRGLGNVQRCDSCHSNRPTIKRKELTEEDINKLSKPIQRAIRNARERNW